MIERETAASAGAPESRTPTSEGDGPAFDITTRHCGSHVRVTIGGSVTLDRMLCTLNVLGLESETWTEQGVLIDLWDLSSGFGRPELVRCGEEIACSFGHVRKLALLVPPHRVTRISERIARRNGVDMRVFDTEVAALAWVGEP